MKLSHVQHFHTFAHFLSSAFTHEKHFSIKSCVSLEKSIVSRVNVLHMVKKNTVFQVWVWYKCLKICLMCRSVAHVYCNTYCNTCCTHLISENVVHVSENMFHIFENVLHMVEKKTVFQVWVWYACLKICFMCTRVAHVYCNTYCNTCCTHLISENVFSVSTCCTFILQHILQHVLHSLRTLSL